jgi:hypothetical protein
MKFPLTPKERSPEKILWTDECLSRVAYDLDPTLVLSSPKEVVSG